MTAITVTLTYIAGKRLRDPERAIVPETTLTPRNFFEIVLDGIMSLAEDGVGPKYAKQILPLVGTVTIYVFFSNILGLIPGFAPPTPYVSQILRVGPPHGRDQRVATVRQDGKRIPLPHQ